MQHKDRSKRQRQDEEEVFSFVGDEEHIKQLEQELINAREQISYLENLLAMERGKTCHMDTINKNMQFVLEVSVNLAEEKKKLQTENERLKILTNERYNLARFFKDDPPVSEDNSDRFEEVKSADTNIPDFYK